ncbi:DUF2914 domain-containing protein [Pseudoalteromonas aurantia]|uniref:DUF2914 domain-containing protein n=1 Tax=Pseudoalteromonas aurantia TaxID=43654 RepID=A0A5S3VA08_9GAMM|nr:DUF2914 domain-containing protein [Pseudoalteromonas aurantia]TMO67668.1 DUF2914 domain-containing protein [Pseudoalteromonas aurantia]TMO68753.1 DUF2914 domain-containing protein [Pseudoalteromonas aurantia]TMO78919.1 DUF2914 domain-containing protein [Pseudoalteromonas aurantia]
MTQRIVIKTAVTKTAPTVQTVSYQWHWRRIFAVSSVVLLSVAGVTYGLTNAVNADEIQTEALADTHSDMPVVTEPADEGVSPEGLTLQSNLNRGNELVTGAVESQHRDSTVASSVSVPASEDVVNVEPVKNIEDSPVVVNEDTEQEDVQDAKQDIIPGVSETVFSESAQVANVALGAKIDTNVVSRAVLTTGIEQREPVDVLKDNLKRTQFSEKLYFFTEIKNLQGKIIHHLWFHQDQLMAEIPLTVGAVRYRTYSSKNIMPSQTGQWRVEVVTQQGQLLAQKSFRIIPDAQ